MVRAPAAPLSDRHRLPPGPARPSLEPESPATGSARGSLPPLEPEGIPRLVIRGHELGASVPGVADRHFSSGRRGGTAHRSAAVRPRGADTRRCRLDADATMLVGRRETGPEPRRVPCAALRRIAGSPGRRAWVRVRARGSEGETRARGSSPSIARGGRRLRPADEAFPPRYSSGLELSKMFPRGRGPGRLPARCGARVPSPSRRWRLRVSGSPRASGASGRSRRRSSGGGRKTRGGRGEDAPEHSAPASARQDADPAGRGPSGAREAPWPNGSGSRGPGGWLPCREPRCSVSGTNRSHGGTKWEGGDPNRSLSKQRRKRGCFPGNLRASFHVNNWPKSVPPAFRGAAAARAGRPSSALQQKPIHQGCPCLPQPPTSPASRRRCRSR